MEILPSYLRAEITTFFYSNAIAKISILDNREMRFYCDYLNKFEPMSIKSMSVFAKEGSTASEVYFLLKGCVECVNSNKFYLEGTVFGETDVVLKRPRLD